MKGATGRDGVTLFLAGDVMTGRGVDQVLPHSVPPDLYEQVMTSAEGYVTLAERRAGAEIPDEPGWSYVWGDALDVLEVARPDARIVNLETAVTLVGDPAPKGINYRMHPGNVPVLTAADLDACVLANNHVLDWGADGLLETLEVVEGSGIAGPGAGRDLQEARAPAVLPVPSGRIVVAAVGVGDSGIPPGWAATAGRPGVHLLPDLSDGTVDELAGLVAAHREPGDLVVLSIHWGSNWGYRIPDDHRRFARAVVERAGVDVVHGHSSHHPRAVEVHREKVIFYGCGDLLNDYEGIGGREEFRSQLALMYLPTLEAGTGRLLRLEMRPMRIWSFRLNDPTPGEVEWMRERMDRECRRFGRGVTAEETEYGPTLLLD